MCYRSCRSGHVIKLPQDVASFANSLPRLPSELDIIVVRKEGAASTHRDFRVRRGHALQWLLANNRYYLNVRINLDALALPQEDGNLTGLHSVIFDSTIDDPEPLSAWDEDPYDAHFSRSFIPSTTQGMTNNVLFNLFTLEFFCVNSSSFTLNHTCKL